MKDVMKKKEKCVGVLGGMGPEATVDFMSRLIRLTPAREDGDHVRCIVDNNPKVPSRIRALLEGGEDPAPCLIDMAQRLEKWGADLLAMPCNTAHYWHARVQAAVGIPLLHMPELTARALRGRYPDLERAGILGTTATVRTGIYDAVLKPLGMEAVYPDPWEQEELLRLILSIKAGRTGSEERACLEKLRAHLEQKGAPVWVPACTELSVIAPAEGCVDASQVLAEAVLAFIKSA